MLSSGILEIFLQFTAQIKLYHWQTKNYSRHKASDELFGKIQDLIDSFVETYQGSYERIYLKKDTKIPLYNLTDNDIRNYVIEFRDFLMDDLDNIKNSDLLNIRDEILATLNQTLYLFTLN